jgi:hypothetical protein
MIEKLQPSPASGARGAPLRVSIAPWGSRPANLQQVRFFRSWLVYDSDFESNRTHGRINWNMVASMVLMLAVSAAGWASLGLLVTRFWK